MVGEDTHLLFSGMLIRRPPCFPKKRSSRFHCSYICISRRSQWGVPHSALNPVSVSSFKGKNELLASHYLLAYKHQRMHCYNKKMHFSYTRILRMVRKIGFELSFLPLICISSCFNFVCRKLNWHHAKAARCLDCVLHLAFPEVGITNIRGLGRSDLSGLRKPSKTLLLCFSLQVDLISG